MTTDARIAPADMLKALAAIATLPWRELDRADRACFAEAGDAARIAEVPAAAQAVICEALDLRATFEGGLMAIIGGDGPQIELHGVASDGEPLGWCLPLNPFEQ